MAASSKKQNSHKWHQMSAPDTHALLVSQGWSGRRGSPLRHGALSTPLLVSRKPRSLSGLGRDRDRAVPFWDHVFAATAVAIGRKLRANDDRGSVAETSSLTPSDPDHPTLV